MGGGVSIPVALSSAQKEILEGKYQLYQSRGCDDAELEGMLAKRLPGIVLFDQIDADHSGSISRAELKAMLKALPRNKPVPPPGGWPGGAAPAFVPFEAMLQTLDSDGDGTISMDEWLDNLEKLPGLKAAIGGALDPATGRIAGYVSLEARVEQLLAEAAALEEAAAPAPDEAQAARLAGLRQQAAELQSAVGTAGLTVFRQLDADGSGKIDRDELCRALKELPKTDPAFAEISIDDVMKALDYDGDGVIDELEWTSQLYRLPALKVRAPTGARARAACPRPPPSRALSEARPPPRPPRPPARACARSFKDALERSVDPATGKVKGLRSLMAELKDVRAQLAAAEAAGADTVAALKAREAELASHPAVAKHEKDRGEWAQSAKDLLANIGATPAAAEQ